jgi:sigma-B regulation protein RsbU (phosphoserine phosphatase)
MKFRWKLSLIMLAVSILPIILLRTFGIHNVRIMASALAEEVENRRSAEARNEIQSLLNGSRETLNLERERIAMGLSFLSDVLRRGSGVQIGEPGPPHKPAEAVFPPAAAQNAPSRLCVTTPETESPAKARQAAWLVQSEAAFAAISEHLGDLVLRQHFAFSSGVSASYPCPHPGFRSGDVTLETWYRAAFVESIYSWSRPFWDDPTGRWALSISVLWENGDEKPMGVASVTVTADRLLENMLAFLNLPSRSRAFLGVLDQNTAAGTIGLKVLLEANAPQSAEPQWLPMPEPGLAAAVMDDVARRTSRIVRMPFEGRDAFWSYTPLPYQGSALVLIVPAADLLEPAHPVQAAIQDRLRRVETLTASFVALLAVINALIVLFFSRTVTRPLETLSKAAGQLAAGDFDARVDIVSTDEFKSMGAVFNRVGPQLKEHYRVREALQAAVEIQQSLLPNAPPNIPGLDIFAMSLYSEKIGGDYYDYLCVGQGGRERLCVAVGDVSGHGISSAITMATARAFLRLRASLPGTLGDIVADVNRKFVEDVEYSGQFMTLFLARIDRKSRRVEWVRAGHDPAFLYDFRRSQMRELAGQGAPLGVSDRSRFEESALAVEPGQVIVIGTDGIWEASNQAGEMFGKARLIELIRQHAEATAQAVVLAVLDAVEEFRGADKPEDDITLMAIKFDD